MCIRDRYKIKAVEKYVEILQTLVMEHFIKIFWLNNSLQTQLTNIQKGHLMVSFKDSWRSHCDWWRAEHQKTTIKWYLNVVLEILALKIQRLVSFSESRIKLTKQKLFSADCFCSFLHKFQIFWREIVHHPLLWHYLVCVLA